MVIVFSAHEFPELLLAFLLPVSPAGASSLRPNKKDPNAQGHRKVWKRVCLV